MLVEQAPPDEWDAWVAIERKAGRNPGMTPAEHAQFDGWLEHYEQHPPTTPPDPRSLVPGGAWRSWFRR